MIRISVADLPEPSMLSFIDSVNARPYESCSFSMYKKSEAIAIAGKTNPTSGTKMEGRYKLIKNKFGPHDSAKLRISCLMPSFAGSA
jgi:hypothetical protein